jgi:hypothetical protein
MDQRESAKETNKDSKTKTPSISDIDQLCHLIDRSSFTGLQG